MSGFKPYPAYRDSGVKWFRKVPEHWNVCRMAHLEQGGDDFVSGPFGSSLGSSDYIDEGIPVIRGVNTTLRAERKFVEEDFVFVAEEKYAELCRCNAVPGDLIFTARGTVGKVALVPGSIPISLISPNQLRLRPGSKKVIAEYFYYMFSSENLLAEVYLSSDSVAQPNMNLGSLKAIKVMLPPPNEQTQIARFLDHETARIDALIEEQQRLIELLKEKRQAVISHAVTKGLDPTVPMKDSGVEWLGEMPAHWSFKQSKYLFEFVTSGSRGWAEYYSDDGDLFFRITNLTRDSIEPKLVSLQYVMPPENAEGERSRVRSGDILISITADLGSVCVANDEVSGSYVSQHVALARPMRKTVFSRWLAYFVLSATCKDQLVGAGYGGTKVQLSLDDIRSFWVSMPPYDEQVSIAVFLDKEIQSFDGLIMEAAIGVELLSERRSALISAAVTGKIDVRAWQPPASIQAPEFEVAEAV